MSVTIKKNQSSKQIDKKMNNLSQNKEKKGIDTSAYFGKINFGVDGLDYQKKIRDEWA